MDFDRLKHSISVARKMVEIGKSYNLNVNELQELFSSLTLIEIMVLKQYFAAVDTSINDELNSYIMTKSSKDIKIILNNYRYISSINFDDNI